MARGKQTVTYAKPPFGLVDAAFCGLMTEVLAWDVRADVRRSAAVIALHALTRCWPASHYPKRDRDGWAFKATAAFRVSERELAELCGFSRQRVRTALRGMLDAGFVVELAPAKPWGEGRGTAPATYAFRCHVAGASFNRPPVSSSRVSSEAPDQRSPAQPWLL